MPERNISSAFWTDPKITVLPYDARVVFLYLITNGHAHVSGVYHLPLRTAADEMGIPEERVAKALLALTSGPRPIAWYDADTHEVWVLAMLKRQGNNESVFKSAWRKLRDIHSPVLKAGFAGRYPTTWEAFSARRFAPTPDNPQPESLSGNIRLPHMDTVSDQGVPTPCTDTVYRHPSGTGSGPGAGTGASSQSCMSTKLPPSPESDDSGGVKSASQSKSEQPKPREAVTPQTERRTSPRCALPALSVEAFEQDFWPAYPRKVAKGDARKEWRGLRVDGGAKVVMDALGRDKLGEWKHRDPGMIPYPARWLSMRRWEDLADEKRYADEARARAKQAVQAARERFATREGSEDRRGGEQVAQQATVSAEDAVAPQEFLTPKPPERRRVYSREEVEEQTAGMTRADADAFEEHLRKAGQLANEGEQQP